MVLGKPLDLDLLALRQVGLIPRQRIHPPVRLLAAGIIHLAVIFERTVVVFLQRLNEPHHGFGRIPRVHQYGLEGQCLLIDDVAQHLTYMIEFAMAITVRVVNPVVNAGLFNAPYLGHPVVFKH